MDSVKKDVKLEFSAMLSKISNVDSKISAIELKTENKLGVVECKMMAIESKMDKILEVIQNLSQHANGSS